MSEKPPKFNDSEFIRESSTWPAPIFPTASEVPLQNGLYSIRLSPPQELVPFLQKVVEHSGLIQPNAQDLVLAFLLGQKELQINLSPLSKMEMRLMGFSQFQVPIFRGLLSVLTRRALALPVPAGVFSALSVQADFHWARAESLKALKKHDPSKKVKLINCDSDVCSLCESHKRFPQTARMDLVDEMISMCTCYPYCHGHFVAY